MKQGNKTIYLEEDEMAKKYYDENGNEIKKRGGCLKLY